MPAPALMFPTLLWYLLLQRAPAASSTQLPVLSSYSEVSNRKARRFYETKEVSVLDVLYQS